MKGNSCRHELRNSEGKWLSLFYTKGREGERKADRFNDERRAGLEGFSAVLS